jgi:hypothetical protein
VVSKGGLDGKAKHAVFDHLILNFKILAHTAPLLKPSNLTPTTLPPHSHHQATHRTNKGIKKKDTITASSKDDSTQEGWEISMAEESTETRWVFVFA